MLLIGDRTVSESQTKHSNSKNSFLVSSMETVADGFFNNTELLEG